MHRIDYDGHIKRDFSVADIYSIEKRSQVMSRIRGRGNRNTELRIVHIFRAHGVTGWRRNSRVFGKPDFIFPKERIAVFVDGCFWHGCRKPKHSVIPKQNADFWAVKLARNITRDKLVTHRLRTLGWRVIRIWEHELSGQNKPQCVRRIQRAIAASTVLVHRKGSIHSVAQISRR